MDNKEVKKLVSEARKHREYGQFAEALAILHQINNEFTDNVQYRYLLAATYYESMNVESALKYAEEAISLDPAYKEAYELIGDIYIKQDERERAIEYYEKGYHLDNHYTYIEEKLIQAYLKSGNYEKAIIICDNLISHVPVDISTAKSRMLTSTFMATVMYKGIAFIYLKRYKEAIQQMFNRKELNIKTNSPTYINQYRDDDESIFKMYSNLGDKIAAGQYRALLKEDYQLTDEEIRVLEEEAQNDIILKRQRYNIPF